MHLHLIDLLADPRSRSTLTLEPGAASVDGEITAGFLRSQDGTRYEIREGVARMVPDVDSSVTVDEGATQPSIGPKRAH
jgi:uncharacterized protein YbaR (Trm112 family)